MNIILFFGKDWKLEIKLKSLKTPKINIIYRLMVDYPNFISKVSSILKNVNYIKNTHIPLYKIKFLVIFTIFYYSLL
jgi:hypothetical protein